MRLYNRYIITIATLLIVTTAILTAFGVNSLAIYYVIYIIEAFIVTELYRQFSPRARRGLNIVSIILLGGFVPIIILQFVKLLA